MRADREGEDADWAWAREYARKAPDWSDQKWRTMNVLLRLRVSEREQSDREYRHAS